MEPQVGVASLSNFEGRLLEGRGPAGFAGQQVEGGDSSERTDLIWECRAWAACRSREQEAILLGKGMEKGAAPYLRKDGWKQCPWQGQAFWVMAHL